MAWNEQLSNKLKNLKLIQNPNAQQQAKIVNLQSMKAGAGKVVSGVSPVATNNSGLSQSLQGLAATGTDPMARTITPESFAAQRQAFTDQQYQALTADYAQRQEQQRQQLEQDLYNRGYRPDQTSTTGPGSWSGMTQDFNKSWNDAYLQAGAQAAQLGGQEFDRQFGAQEDIINSQLQRELGLGQLAQTSLDRQQRMKELQKQLASNAAIARINKGGSGGYRAVGSTAYDPGFDVIGGTI